MLINVGLVNDYAITKISYIIKGGGLMVFWDNLSQKASETTAKAMQKAKGMSDIAKFNPMIAEEETQINNV